MATALTETQIISLVRKGIRQPSPTTVKTTDISLSIETAIDVLGQILVGSDPQYFRKRVTLQADYAPHIFSLPSDMYRLAWVKDLGTNAGAITGASNASPIVITQASHGFADDDIVTIHDVAGNTAANGTWQITYVGANSYSLDGSTGNDDYTSGGLAFKDEDDFTEILRKDERDADNSSPLEWFPRANNIIVDDPTFENDILIGYTYRPSTIAQIPAEFHRMGLESFGVIDNIELPSSESPKFVDLKASYDRHKSRWSQAQKRASWWRMPNESKGRGKARFM